VHSLLMCVGGCGQVARRPWLDLDPISDLDLDLVDHVSGGGGSALLMVVGSVVGKWQGGN